jgi:ABC-type Zn uptake system ZnuABC Zn-binding protein ZnuA
MRWLSILVVALALVAAGCGGGSNESAATTETTTESTTTESTATTDESSTESTDTTDLSGILGDEDCLALASVGATIAAAFSGANGSTNGSEELQNLADKVPDAIKADVQTLAAAFSEYAAKLKDIGIEPGATPTAAQLQQLQTAIASLNQDELTAASQRIEAWAQENCKAAGG